jgi:hypothetical protein
MDLLGFNIVRTYPRHHNSTGEQDVANDHLLALVKKEKKVAV